MTRDLKPYICVFEECSIPETVFDNFQDWIMHMKAEQMPPEWLCVSPSHGPITFKSQDLFEIHMRAQHPRAFTEAQLPALAKKRMRLSLEIFTHCPFCSYLSDADGVSRPPTRSNQDEMQHHIASHLQSLALISLQLVDMEDESGFESCSASRAACDGIADGC